MAADITNLQTTRWRKYGHDRLYVEHNGTRIGYWDLNTDTPHPEAPEHEDAIRDAFNQWHDPHRDEPKPVTPPAAEAAPEPAPAPAREPEVGPSDAEFAAELAALVPSGLGDTADPLETTEPRWDDLANTKAGAAARAQAQALRDAAPVKTLLARALGVKTDERAWRIGADGEEAVAAQLRKLGERWHILHAVPIGDRGSDIDHVVIGPAGVFTLNAKNHPDANIWVRGNTFKVNGQNVPYVRNSRYEATRTAKLLGTATGLEIPVTGAIVIYGATGGLTIKEQPQDVHIVARRQVTQWLRKLPTALTDEQVAHIYDHARRSTTWQPGRP